MENIKTVLCDASSAILLFRAGIFPLLTACYRVLFSETVYRELTVSGYAGSDFFREVCTARAVKIQPPVSPGFCRGPEFIPENLPENCGEGESIRIWMGGIGDFILIDDRKGAAFCRDHAIPYINALLLPRILCLSGYLSAEEYREKTEEIIRLGRYSPNIIQYARHCPEAGLSPFVPSAR